MGQDIFNTNGSSTGNLVQGVAIIKEPGINTNTKGVQVGFNNLSQGSGVVISSLTGLFKERFDDPSYYG